MYSAGTTAPATSYPADMLVHHFLTDSLQHDLDSVRTWLANKGGLLDRFQVVDTWLTEGDATKAQQALDTIPLLFALSGDSLVEYSYFDSLKTLQVAALVAAQDEAQMVAQHQTDLQRIADAGEYAASIEAEAILDRVLGEAYPPVITLPDTTAVLGLAKKPKAPAVLGAESMDGYFINAVPNPAKTQATFRYMMPENARTGKILVTSVDGREVVSLGIAGSTGQVVWATKDVPRGVYFYSLWAGGRKLGTKRLVITK